MFPGFAERSTVPLPGKLEPLPLLDTVTKTLTLPVSLWPCSVLVFCSEVTASLYEVYGLGEGQ